MKRKILALLVIMVMVLTVTTVAVTAKPANAASTQAGAPMGGSANVQAPNLVGVGGVGTPAICFNQNDGNFFLFERGTDHALWYEVYNYSADRWSSWTSIGGYLTSDPSAMSFGYGSTVIVSVRGADGALYENYYYDYYGQGIWTGWISFGGQLLAGTGPSSWTTSNYGYFVTGTDHALYGYDIGTGKWQKLGGYLTSSPATASPTFGLVNVFARGADGGLWVRGYNGAWSDWQSLGGQIAPGTAPSACAYEGRFDVFVTGTDRAMYHMWYTGAWSGWENVGGYLTSSPEAVLATFPPGPPNSSSDLYIDVSVRGGDHSIWENEYYGGGWRGWWYAGWDL